MTSAAELIRDSRKQGGLTQAQLAEAAGVTQSVISAYENGRREPSFDQLTRLVTATGNRLDVAVVPRGPRLAEVRDHGDALKAALGALGARRIRVFGSVARGTESVASDVDLLVDLDEGVGLIALGMMQTEAERILGGAVDIVPSTGLKADVVDSVMRDAVPL